MELLRTEIREGEDGYQRLVGLVRYDDNTTEEYWFETLPEYRLCESGNVWLATLLPLAATIGEPIRLNLPIDPLFYIKARALLRLWKSWFPHLHTPPIEADQQQVDLGSNRESASFFSAGVDAFFTALRYPDAKNLILWLGFDMPIEYRSNFRRHVARLKDVAAEMGRPLIHGVTNLRRTRWARGQWESLCVGPALGAVALLLERHLSRVYVPSSRDYGALRPWGSHPLSDELFTTSQTEIIHEGTEYTRGEKIGFLAEHDIAMRHLHVCFRGQTGTGQDETNCCRCRKCFRTMIVLGILGKLDQARLFDAKAFTPERISSIFLDRVEEAYFHQMKNLALARGRPDIASGIDGAMANSKKVRPWVEFAEKISRYPFLWRYGPELRKRVLNGMIAI